MSVQAESDFIVSIHVPKTAGTTLGSVFDRCFSRRVIYDYDGYANPGTASPLMRQGREFVSSYFRVLHGHFFASKYRDVFPAAKFISTVRHPVDRVISQYNHELNENSGDAAYHDDLVSGRMDVVEFARQPGIGNAFDIHLSGIALIDYDLILVQEYFEQSLRVFDYFVARLELGSRYGPGSPVPQLNGGDRRPKKAQITEAEKQAIFNATHLDNEIYRESVALLGVKIRSIKD